MSNTHHSTISHPPNPNQTRHQQVMSALEEAKMEERRMLAAPKFNKYLAGSVGRQSQQ